MVTQIRALTQQLDDYASEFATHLDHTFVDPRAESEGQALPSPVTTTATPAAKPAPVPRLLAATRPQMGS